MSYQMLRLTAIVEKVTEDVCFLRPLCQGVEALFENN